MRWTAVGTCRSMIGTTSGRGAWPIVSVPRVRAAIACDLRSRVGDEARILLAEAFDRDPHAVAGAQEFRRLETHRDAARRAGRDHVARIERHELADIADDVLDPEDQVGGVAVLPAL